MSAITPLHSHRNQWPLASPDRRKEQLYTFRRAADSRADSVIWFSSTSSHEVRLDGFASFGKSDESGDQSRLKKLYHNASERNRRRKLNASYSSLRSLLPAADRGRKLSIPDTLSRVLQYLPELRQEVEGLAKRKEELLKRISEQTADHFPHQETRKGATNKNFAPGIIAKRLSDREIMVQIWVVHGSPQLSKTLLVFEEYGLHVMAAASFTSAGKRVFHSIHLEMEGNCQVNFNSLNRKLSSLYQNAQLM